MSIDYSLIKVQNDISVCWVEIPSMKEAYGMPVWDLRGKMLDGKLRRLSFVTHSIIHLSVTCGWGQYITDENAPDVFARISMVESLNGTIVRTGEGDPINISAHDVRDHVGLWTNARKLTWVQFRNHLCDQFTQRMRSRYAYDLSVPREDLPVVWLD